MARPVLRPLSVFRQRTQFASHGANRRTGDVATAFLAPCASADPAAARPLFRFYRTLVKEPGRSASARVAPRLRRDLTEDCGGSASLMPLLERRHSLVEQRYEAAEDHALTVERHGHVLHAFVRLHFFA